MPPARVPVEEPEAGPCLGVWDRRILKVPGPRRVALGEANLGRGGAMTIFLVVVGVIVLSVLVLGVRYDRKQRRIGAASGLSKSMRSTRLDNQTQVGKWGAGI